MSEHEAPNKRTNTHPQPLPNGRVAFIELSVNCVFVLLKILIMFIVAYILFVYKSNISPLPQGGAGVGFRG
jgi:hypothetical protein